MPNWAMANITATGAIEGVKSFANRFVYRDKDLRTIPGKKFFYRSFIQDDRAFVIQEIEDIFRDLPEATVASVHLDADFAWSVYGCVISGHPEKHQDECLTLVEACKEDKVSVEIEAYENGMCFEEFVTCDADGNLSYKEKTMPQYKCRRCGDVSSYPSFEDPKALTCCECGEGNLELVIEEVK